MLVRLFVILIPLLLASGAATAVSLKQSPSTQTPATVSGEQKRWHPLIIDFAGPYAHETGIAPNPFLDYRLQVTFNGPNGRVYHVPGFFAGDGQGHGSGSVWRVIFAPDAAGAWHYTASFRAGTNIAVDLDPIAGVPHSFDGAAGTVHIAPLSCDEPGFLRWGRLEYVGDHYLKFAGGDYWIKGGTDSPENFMAYAGFDNTFSQGGIIHDFIHFYPDHVADWREGDPNFVSQDTGYDAKGIIGALNYLASQHVNSIYFLPMNLGGDGQDTYPFISPANNAYAKTHYDISKLHQWGIVFDHAQRQGIALQLVLAETENENEEWLDGGQLGVERKLFFRELIARFGHLLALKWNLSEENDFPPHLVFAFTDYIQALDWSRHPLGLHSHINSFTHYEYMLGDPRFTNSSIQYTANLAGSHVEYWRAASAQAGQPWVLDMDENADALSPGDSIANDLRRRILYPVYFSGGNIEWYMGYHNLPVGGDINLENFRTRETMWRYTWYARQFMMENLPFWEMMPQDQLLNINDASRGAGEVFTKPGQIYAVYMPLPGGSLNLTAAPGLFTMRWFQPNTGEFVGQPVTVAGGSWLDFGEPPSRPNGDWVVLLERIPPAAHQLPGAHTLFLPMIFLTPDRTCPPGPIP